MSLHYLRPYPFVLVSLFPTSTLRIDPADQWSMTNEVSDNVLASLTTRLRGGRKQLSPLSLVLTSKPTGLFIDGLGGGEREVQTPRSLVLCLLNEAARYSSQDDRTPFHFLIRWSLIRSVILLPFHDERSDGLP